MRIQVYEETVISCIIIMCHPLLKQTNPRLQVYNNVIITLFRVFFIGDNISICIFYLVMVIVLVVVVDSGGGNTLVIVIVHVVVAAAISVIVL